MTKTKRQVLGLGITALVIGVSAWAFLNRHDITRSLERVALPEETRYQQLSTSPAVPHASIAGATKKPITTALPVQTNLPGAINLAIPFTSQAPSGKWDPPFKEFCEEASVLMAMRYVQNKPITGPADATAGMLAIHDFEVKEFGYYQDTTAEQTAQIFQKYFKYTKVKVLPNPTVADIKRALADGKPVIVPAAGRRLGNPYYTPPGPLYHMLVIKGYTTKNQFITHDPGTRRGADYLYNANVLMNAMHDWQADGNVEAGRKVVLIVG